MLWQFLVCIKNNYIDGLYWFSENQTMIFCLLIGLFYSMSNLIGLFYAEVSLINMVSNYIWYKNLLSQLF